MDNTVFEKLLEIDPTKPSLAYPKGMRRIVLAYTRAKQIHYRKEGFSMAYNKEEYPNEKQEKIKLYKQIEVDDEGITQTKYELIKDTSEIIYEPVYYQDITQCPAINNSNIIKKKKK